VDKDFDLKNGAQDSSKTLRGRILQLVKPQEGEGRETKQPGGKQVFLIPVTGGLAAHKYFTNKSRMKFS
jgi:hypothetical protein